MSLTNLLIPTYRQMLRTLGGLLEKTQQQMPEEAEALLSARLIDDMFPLSAQVRFAAFQAQEAVFKLRSDTVPQSLNAVAAEGRNAGETPGSISDAQMRISEALSFLDGVPADGLDTSASLPIAIELPGGHYI